MKSSGTGTSRRTFIKRLLPGWLSIVVGPSAYAWLRSTYLGQNQVPPEGPIIVCELKDLPVGKSKLVQYGPDRVLLIRLADTEVLALSGVCTHLGCLVRHQMKGETQTIVCSCHNSFFGLDGENLSGPASLPLNQYSARILDEQIELSDDEP